jgi:hypothetical protein
VLAWIGGTIPSVTAHWSAIAIQVIVALIAIGAAVFGALRPGPLRIPLLTAGVMILILWFAAPLLQAPCSPERSKSSSQKRRGTSKTRRPTILTPN